MNPGKVTIELKAIHHTADGIENMTRVLSGELEKTDGLRILKYMEASEDGDQVDNVLTIHDGKAHLLKQGTTIWDIHFVPYQETKSLYKTAFGNFDMLVKATTVTCFESDEQLRIRIVYELTISGVQTSLCQLSMSVLRNV